MIKLENDLILISANDDVGVALRDLEVGTTIPNKDDVITLIEDIPFAHKVALKDIEVDTDIIKYGSVIGKSTASIKKGGHVHSHNMKTNLDDLLEYSFEEEKSGLESLDISGEATFSGYLREDGRAGTRNDVWIVPTVGCVNVTAKRLEETARKAFGDRVDNILAITHNVGCSQLGDDHETTQKLLSGIINNPNAGAVLVVSLGCENNNLDEFKPWLGEINEDRIKFITTQNADNEYEEGMELIEQLVEFAEKYKREELPVSKLTIGYQCGGSDAFSGITANPLCGKINDRLVSKGGSTILTEVPEMFGAETTLMERAQSKEVFHNIVDLINDFKKYFQKYDQVIYENPAPGNKAGGITTLEEKSLGCTQKGGTTPVMGVLNYGEQIQVAGLNLLTGSGNDQVSCTNLLASGANVMLFTTGRGNPFGTPVPTIKISSNTNLYNRKKHWIDYDAGRILDENITMDDAADELWELFIDVASGKKETNNEKYGYKEISMFRDGVIL